MLSSSKQYEISFVDLHFKNHISWTPIVVVQVQEVVVVVVVVVVLVVLVVVVAVVAAAAAAAAAAAVVVVVAQTFDFLPTALKRFKYNGFIGLRRSNVLNMHVFMGYDAQTL